MGLDKDGIPAQDSAVVIEPDDEGEVLLIKIRKLKKELREYEAQFDSVSSYKNSETTNGPGLHGRESAGTTTLLSDELEPYQLLEEKHRLSRLISASTTSTSRVNGARLVSNQSDLTTDEETTTTCQNTVTTREDTVATLPETASRHTASLSSFNSVSQNSGSLSEKSTFDQGAAKSRFDVDADKRNVAPAGTNATTTTMRRGDRAGALLAESQPGAISVQGLNTPTPDQHSARRLGGTDGENSQTQPINEETNETSGPLLLRAALVDEEAGTTGAGPLVAAKRDPWYRRNQWWLAGVLVMVVVAIALSVTLTTVNLSAPAAPTMSPTTRSEGIETDTEEIVMASFPAAANTLNDETSSQVKALRWLSERRFNDPSKFGTSRILQQYALATFFLSTLGDSAWIRKDGWLNNTDECTWYGVNCEAGRTGGEKLVIGLSLFANNISGTIPPDLSILSTNLLAIDLSTNRLVGTIPSEIGLLSLLTAADLSFNRVGGRIPLSIKSLLSLESLKLSSNVLTGSIPHEIESLTMLRLLDLRDNDLIDVLPTEIGRLARLEHFDCEANRIASRIPTEIAFLTKLEVFHGGSNELINLPSEIGSLKNLRSLDISQNLITGTIPYHIAQLLNLTSLDLSSNLLSGTVPRNIGLLRQLNFLSLSDNNLFYVLPPSIGLLRDLAYLDVSGNEIDLETVGIADDFDDPNEVPWIDLAQLTNLISLDLGGMLLDRGYAEFLTLTNLQILSLSGSSLESTRVISGVSLLSSLAVLTTLREIDFSNTQIGVTNPEFETSALPTELGLLTRLEVLDLHGNLFTGRLISNLGELSQLSVLNLEGSVFSSTIPSEFFNLSKLTSLDLGGRQYFPGTTILYDSATNLGGSIPSDIGRLTNLKRLNLASSQITGSIPSEIGLTKLEDLNLRQTAINGSLPIEILSLTNLRMLVVDGSDLSGLIPEFSIRFNKVERLILSDSFLYGKIPSGVWSMSMLNTFHANSITGTIPSEVGLLSSLTSLVLLDANLTESTLPSEIGLLQKLQLLDLTGASMNGTIPPDIFACTQLTSLRLAGNIYSGSIPSEIGLATNLLEVDMVDTMVTGIIPTEIGNLLLLVSLDLSNTDITGTIPSELSMGLLLLEYFNLSSSHILGPIPSELAGLLSLRKLFLSNTDLTGTIPSEIMLLDELTDFDISFTSIDGTVPIEMANMTTLDLIDFRGNSISGSIPDALCTDYQVDGPGYFIENRTVYVDCGEVFCACCECFPTAVPTFSLSPSSLPSEPRPSMSVSPSVAPSASIAPSTSISPTVGCVPFSSISDVGTAIFSNGDLDEGIRRITLPFPFKWRGQTEFLIATVSTNGVIVLGDLLNSDNLFAYVDCCELLPVGELRYLGLPRILLAQNDLAFPELNTLPGNVYYATVGDTFVISFEGADFYPVDPDILNLYFQVVLFPHGRIEMRWGQGVADDGIEGVAAGLEDVDITIPASGEPFDSRGVAQVWPVNQCRIFDPTSDGSYTEDIP